MRRIEERWSAMDMRTPHSKSMARQWRACVLPALVAVLTACTTVQESPLKYCGQIQQVETNNGTTTRIAIVAPDEVGREEYRIALVVLAGGGGFINLDGGGCPRALNGSASVRFLPMYRRFGFITVLVDAPTGYFGEDGLAGFRASSAHASDIGKIVALVRAQTKRPVWIIGHSRGAISALNAAASLSQAEAPNGLVITSPAMYGHPTKKKPWVGQTVFDFPLEKIAVPTLLVGHAEDKCLRSPPDQLAIVSERLGSLEKQMLIVRGGVPGSLSLDACEGKAPHGFSGQDAEVVEAMVRFISAQKKN